MIGVGVTRGDPEVPWFQMNHDLPPDDSTPPPESTTAPADGAATGPAAVTGASSTAPQESKGSKEVLEFTADFPGLVDPVVGDDGGVWFWFLWPDGSHFTFLQKHAGGRTVGDKDVLDIPPPRSALAWLLPRGAEVHRWLKGDNDAAYFADLQEWIRRHVDLADERHVVLLAAWIAHTYLVDLCSASPYIVLLGPPETGKSRALAACIHAARRGVLTMNAREAALIRHTDEHKATIAIDAIDFMEAIRNSMEFFAARTKNDGTVTTRILDYRKGRFQGMQHYEAFGATLVASNKPLSNDVIGSRSLVIQACQGTRRFLENVKPELALTLRERGTAFEHEFYNAPVGESCHRSRTWHWDASAIYCLASHGSWRFASLRRLMCSKALVPSFATARQTEAADTVEIDILRECLTMFGAGAGQVLLKELAEAVNAARTGERAMSGRGLAPVLRSLGFVYAGAGNQRFVRLDSPKLTPLAKRYGLEIRELTSYRRRLGFALWEWSASRANPRIGLLELLS